MTTMVSNLSGYYIMLDYVVVVVLEANPCLDLSAQITTFSA